jgi:hypothetical protein
MMHQDPSLTPELHEELDPWHRHVPAEEGRPQAEHGARAKPAALATAFAIIFLSVVALILAVLVYAVSHFSKVRAEMYESASLAEESARVRAALRAEELETFGWVDTERVRLPIDLAMDKVVQDYAEGARADAR